MYYSYQKKLYTREQLEGKTFDETDKPEPLFTVEEMINLLKAYKGCSVSIFIFNVRKYFKQQFNITI